MTSPLFPTALAFATIVPATAAALADWRTHHVPDVFVAAASVPIVTALLATGGSIQRLVAIAAGVGLMTLPLLLIHVVVPGAMGFGDVKLAAPLGGALGLVVPAPALVLLALAVAAALTLATAVCTRLAGVPFAPGLVAGAGTALALGTFQGWNLVA